MKQLLILSGKGGTGKTTIAAAFIELSKAPTCADCDVDAPNLHLVMDHLPPPVRKDYQGLPKAWIDPSLCIQCGRCKEHCRFDAILALPKYRVEPYSCEGCGVCEAVCPVGAVEMKSNIAGELILFRNGRVFSTAQLKMGNGTSGKLVSEVKRQLTEPVPDAEFAIIDGSPGIGCPVIASLSGSHSVLMVSEPSVSGISDLDRVIRAAKSFALKTAVCVNKADTNPFKTKEIEKYCREQGLDFVGEIPYDPTAVRAVNEGRTIVSLDCKAGRAVRVVYSKVWELFMKEES